MLSIWKIDSCSSCFNKPWIQSCSAADSELSLSYVQHFPLVQSNNQKLQIPIAREDSLTAWAFSPQSFWKLCHTPNSLSFQSRNLTVSLQQPYLLALLSSNLPTQKSVDINQDAFSFFPLINCIKLSSLPESCSAVPQPVLQPLSGSNPEFPHHFPSFIPKIKHSVKVCQPLMAKQDFS